MPNKNNRKKRVPDAQNEATCSATPCTMPSKSFHVICGLGTWKAVSSRLLVRPVLDDMVDHRRIGECRCITQIVQFIGGDLA